MKSVFHNENNAKKIVEKNKCNKLEYLNIFRMVINEGVTAGVFLFSSFCIYDWWALLQSLEQETQKVFRFRSVEASSGNNVLIWRSE